MRRPLLVSLVLTRCAQLLALSAGSIRMSADVPVALRPLQRQEIVDKLDGVPVFSVVNRQTQQVVPTAAENGVLCCYFHVDVDEAAASLAKLQARNPTLELALTATPLGTAYALCEWERQASQEDEEEDEEALGFADDDDYEGDSDAPKIELRLQAPLHLRASAPPRLRLYASPPCLCAPAPPRLRTSASPRLCTDAPLHRCTSILLQAARAEVEVATPLLAEAPVPPLLRRRNQVSGALPLFGSDQIRFAADEGAGAGSTSLPLFFKRDDLRAAWLASGGKAEAMPPVQVTDLRTLAWQMQYDVSQDWRPQRVQMKPPSAASASCPLLPPPARLPPPRRPLPGRWGTRTLARGRGRTQEVALSTREERPYHAQHVPCTACTMHSMYHAQHVPCTACTMHSTYHAQHVPCTACTMHSMYHAQHVPCTACTMHSMYHARMHRPMHIPCICQATAALRCSGELHRLCRRRGRRRARGAAG